MLFNFFTARFMTEKKNWDAATSNSPVLLSMIIEACKIRAFHRPFAPLSPRAEGQGRGAGMKYPGDWGVAKPAESGGCGI